MAQRRRIFRERKDPFDEYQREGEFRRRYRLSKDTVQNLSDEFGRSQWASKGTKKAKGLSHRERVNTISEIYHISQEVSLVSINTSIEVSFKSKEKVAHSEGKGGRVPSVGVSSVNASSWLLGKVKTISRNYVHWIQVKRKKIRHQCINVNFDL